MIPSLKCFTRYFENTYKQLKRKIKTRIILLYGLKYMLMILQEPENSMKRS